MSNKPGTSSGNRGGIYREIGPRGGPKDNFTDKQAGQHMGSG
jgi:hypothetical protein